jgi:hypothetical protein
MAGMAGRAFVRPSVMDVLDMVVNSLADLRRRWPPVAQEWQDAVAGA